jgi:hypothetical protein
MQWYQCLENLNPSVPVFDILKAVVLVKLHRQSQTLGLLVSHLGHLFGSAADFLFLNITSSTLCQVAM